MGQARAPLGRQQPSTNPSMQNTRSACDEMLTGHPPCSPCAAVARAAGRPVRARHRPPHMGITATVSSKRRHAPPRGRRLQLQHCQEAALPGRKILCRMARHHDELRRGRGGALARRLPPRLRARLIEVGHALRDARHPVPVPRQRVPVDGRGVGQLPRAAGAGSGRGSCCRRGAVRAPCGGAEPRGADGRRVVTVCELQRCHLWVFQCQKLDLRVECGVGDVQECKPVPSLPKLQALVPSCDNRICASSDTMPVLVGNFNTNR